MLNAESLSRSRLAPWLGAERGPLAVFGCMWRHRHLVRRLTEREIEAVFRGSFLGKFWSAIVPLFMLALYTFIFGVVLQVPWSGTTSTAETALFYFTGLIAFNFLFDGVGRAPTLLLENITYIKKVVFPLDILPWVIVCAGLFRLAVSSAILLAFTLAINGQPRLSALAAPVLVLPLAGVVVGAVWFLAALGIYVRDIRQAVGLLSVAAMYLTPIFYPLAKVPERLQWLFYLNPLTFVVEGLRDCLFWGIWPAPAGFLAYTAAAWLFAWAGRSWFMRVRGGFADVV